MADYRGKTCKACNNVFEPEDDIVVCPACGTPQHRICWNELGHCVNEELHSQGYDWAKENSSSQGEKNDSIICSNCHKSNKPGALFCDSCGHPLVNMGQTGSGQQQSYSQQQEGYSGSSPNALPFWKRPGYKKNKKIDGIKVSTIVEYVQVNPYYYVDQFEAISQKGKKVTTNWAACFLSYVWWFSRRNYLMGTVLALVNMLFSFMISPALSEYMDIMMKMYQTGTSSLTADAIDALIPLVLQICLLYFCLLAINFIASLFANKIYMHNVLSDIKEIESQDLSPEEFQYALYKKGGMSIWMGALSYAGLGFVSMILSELVNYIKMIL